MRDITSRLSLGASEQLFLLQRLAVSLFLSDSSVKLPLILDDPLVTSDDDRFLRLMRFVIEVLPKEHQVLIFSCHKRRHEWLRDHLAISSSREFRLSSLSQSRRRKKACRSSCCSCSVRRETSRDSARSLRRKEQIVLTAVPADRECVYPIMTRV